MLNAGSDLAEMVKAKAKPHYITQLAPFAIPTYAKMVKRAQLLEDAMDFTDCIKGKFVKKEVNSGQSSAKPTNGKKRPFNITEGSSQERKPKVFMPNTPTKSHCKHCDKPGHTTDECWRKARACLRCGSREHRIPECPLLKENERSPNAPKKQGDIAYVAFPSRRPRRSLTDVTGILCVSTALAVSGERDKMAVAFIFLNSEI
ncbi:hypothetical protein Taro_001736 [Colocasia esculenta]|uniref:CCHC-type domain-containing protein n=1 Tax=Colocasia esculenta TaxID=4460 RepID=A0A843TEH9_COLES|nr:hypothetical protein [Colocasia esculenta]